MIIAASASRLCGTSIVCPFAIVSMLIEKVGRSNPIRFDRDMA